MQFIISLHDFSTHVLKHDTLKKALPPRDVCFIFSYFWLPWRFLFSLLLKPTSLRRPLFPLGQILFAGFFKAVSDLGGVTQCSYTGRQEPLQVSELLYLWHPASRGYPSPLLVGSKPLLSSPTVTYREVMATTWISPNLIGALSESVGCG